MTPCTLPHPGQSELSFHALDDRGYRGTRDPIACEFRSASQRQHILSAPARDKGDWCDEEEEDGPHNQRTHDPLQQPPEREPTAVERAEDLRSNECEGDENSGKSERPPAWTSRVHERPTAVDAQHRRKYQGEAALGILRLRAAGQSGFNGGHQGFLAFGRSNRQSARVPRVIRNSTSYPIRQFIHTASPAVAQHYTSPHQGIDFT